jgi:predicted Fe-S protein YdhL (DUF1289 family)
MPRVSNSPPSPCTGVCRIDWTSGLPMLKPAEKRAVLAQLPARR